MFQIKVQFLYSLTFAWQTQFKIIIHFFFSLKLRSQFFARSRYSGLTFQIRLYFLQSANVACCLRCSKSVITATLHVGFANDLIIFIWVRSLGKVFLKEKKVLKSNISSGREHDCQYLVLELLYFCLQQQLPVASNIPNQNHWNEIHMPNGRNCIISIILRPGGWPGW